MKLVISEKQLKLIISQHSENQEFTEQSEPADAAPTAGTSSSGDKAGYPEVGKWESGVGREGPANQIGVTKWSDVVGSKLNRGKANQLK